MSVMTFFQFQQFVQISRNRDELEILHQYNGTHCSDINCMEVRVSRKVSILTFA
jgi:hypothetical protein